MVNIDRINAMNDEDARSAFFRCCGSTRWAEGMAARRPFTNELSLVAAADELFDGLQRDDWLEAFRQHPQIGDVDSLRKKFATTADWSSNEQAGVSAANEAVLAELAEGNRRYLDKFGHIFIVCATGKSAAEMLAILKSRIGNEPTCELTIAAEQQRAITELRLAKL